jgi:hypothetical protein
MAKRPDPGAPETPASPQNPGKLTGLGGTRENPGATNDSNETRSGDRVKPPPGYGDAFQKFIQDRSAAGDKK